MRVEGKEGLEPATAPNALWTNEHVTMLIVFDFDLRQNFLRVRLDHPTQKGKRPARGGQNTGGRRGCGGIVGG